MIKAPDDRIASEADIARHLDHLVALDPRFAEVRRIGSEVPLRALAPGFAGLAWVVTGQQISVAAGRAIFTRLEAALGTVGAEELAAAPDETLRAAGLSAGKIRTLRAAAQAVTVDGLDLTALADLEAGAAIAEMVKLHGVGRWTAEVYLLFAAGHADIFPAGDLALRAAAGHAFHGGERPTEGALLKHAEAWRPHRSVAARLLWAYYRAIKGGRETAPV